MRLLLTGASGFLGQTLCRELAAEHEITGLWNTNEPKGTGVRLLRLDLTDHAALDALFAGEHFDAVLHTAALSDPNACQRDPALSRRINVDATAHLAGLCAARGLPLAFTSTDLVFDGLHAPYAEDAPTSPLGVYGQHKVEAENAVLARHPGAVVCRMPLMYGPAVPGARCFLDGMVAAARHGDPLRLFTDEFRTPAHAADAARGLVLAITSGAHGLLHLGGPERISRFHFGEAFARVLAEVGGWPAVRLLPVRQADIAMAATRPPDVSLSSQRAAALGYAPDPVLAGLRRALPEL